MAIGNENEGADPSPPDACIIDEVGSRLQELSRRVGNLDTTVQLSRQFFLDGLMGVLGARDCETRSHSLRVARYAVLLAQRFGFSAEEIDDLEFGALLHDIGKVAIADRVLFKPGRLSDAEWAEMKMHPLQGMRIVAGVRFLHRAGEVVGQHHERFDGTGYPAGLKGEGISIFARIFAAVDTFDAMTSDRPYRAARSADAAMQEIIASKGTQLDPKIADAFVALPRDMLDGIRLGQRDSEAETLAVRTRYAAAAQ